MVTRLRVEFAKELLSDPDITVQDVSTRVGYYNVPSFLRMFRQEVGLTPTQYRESLTE